MSGTVAIRLVGGLGNQMFQYAGAVGIAARNGKALQLDVSEFKVYKTWPYQLDCLDVPQDIYTGGLVVPANSIVARVGRKLGCSSHAPKGVYTEPHFHFDPAVFSLKDNNVVLHGYFQSPLYFDGVEGVVRERFQPKAPLSENATSWAERIAKSPCSISLHVRRGDYVKSAASAVHAALDRSYYDRAVAVMRDLVGPKAQFFLFSDEPEFVAEAFASLPCAEVVRSDPSFPWEDMFLMARCRHNIIANSSYSWWGAWLNSSPDKRVIAPARWFAPDRLAACNVLDLYPDDWILLK